MFNTSVITVTFLKQFLNKSINFARIFPLIRMFQLFFKNHCRELVSWIKGINGEKSLFTEIAKNKNKKREKKTSLSAYCLLLEWNVFTEDHWFPKWQLRKILQ